MKFFLIFYFLFFSRDLKLSTSYTINYGSGIDELGIYMEQEVEPSGPYSFSVDSEGNLYIADPVNSSIKLFSGKERKVLKIFPLKGFFDDMTVSKAGDIYILNRSSSEIIKIDKEGRRETFKIDPGLSLGPCKFLNWKGEIFLKGEGRIKNVLSQGGERDRGISYFYEVEFVNRERGYLKKIGSDGRVLKTFLIERDNIASLEFLNEDKDGNIYLQLEYLISDDKVGLEVRKISQEGETLFVLQIPENDYFIWTSRLLFVDDRGRIYQVLPKRDFVRVNVWE